MQVRLHVELRILTGASFKKWSCATRERKNVNLPGVIVDLPTLTKKDEEDLVKWGVPNDIDLIAASFVRKKSDIEYIRKVPITQLVAPLSQTCFAGWPVSQLLSCCASSHACEHLKPVHTIARLHGLQTSFGLHASH